MPADKKKPANLSVEAASSAPDDGHVSISQSEDRVTLSLHKNSAKAVILLGGATVISWTIEGKEQLFVSDKAILDGSKPVRGGVPLVFPVFGPPPKGTPVESLAQHGFARNATWMVMGKSDETDDTVRVDFGLESSNLDEDTKKKWPYDFGLIYTVTLGPNSLDTSMVVQNPGEKAFDFNVLFHTYFKIPDVSKLSLQGLHQLSYKDKTKGQAEATQDEEELTVSSETDRVYAKVPGDVVIKSEGKPLFTVTRKGVDDVVVWNPWEGGSKMSDFGPADGYKNMICVEAGAVAAFQSLEPNSTWEGGVLAKAHL